MTPFAWKDRPALIEHLFPVQKISTESFKEQMANTGKALTALGSYWKGRKPLILNKACVLGCLLPTSDDALRDLEIFELLMGMDKESLEKRLAAKNDKKSQFFLNDGELQGTPLRALLYALFELSKEVEVEDVLSHLGETYPHYLQTRS